MHVTLLEVANDGQHLSGSGMGYTSDFNKGFLCTFDIMWPIPNNCSSISIGRVTQNEIGLAAITGFL